MQKITPLFSILYPVLSEVLEADFKTAEKKFVEQGIPQLEVKEAFKIFKELKNKIQKPEERDIDEWAKRTWQEFQSFLENMKEKKSGKEIKRLQKMEGAELYAENSNWWVYHIKNHQACMLYGAGTKWCITETDGMRWKQYTGDGNEFYFYIHKHPEQQEEELQKIAVAVNSSGSTKYFDAVDTEIDGLPSGAPPPPLPVIEINGKKMTVEDLKKDPDACKALVTKNFRLNKQFLKSPEVEFSVDNTGVHLSSKWLDTFIPLLEDLGALSHKDAVDLMQYVGPDANLDFAMDWSWEYQDVDSDFFYYLEKDHPKTYEKLKQAIEEVAEETEDEYDDRRSGSWILQHSDDPRIQPIYVAAERAINDGWMAGTEVNAQAYTRSKLLRLSWYSRADVERFTVEENDKVMTATIPWNSLFEADLGDYEVVRERRDGFEADYDSKVARGSFYEGLQEEGFAVD